MVGLPHPTLIAHADWSVRSGKRWIARACLSSSGVYTVIPPEKVGDPRSLLESLRKEAGDDGTVLVGFDFPIGLPLAYARRIQVADFLLFLKQCGEGMNQDFFRIAARAGEISLARPFYPDRPGSKRQAHLLQALEVEEINQLRRRCELARPGQRAAASLFWTLGGQQVGKAALHGWQEVLIPALDDERMSERIRIWPFSGRLSGLIQPGAIVIAETYPAEFYGHLGIELRRRNRQASPASTPPGSPQFGKRSQASRRANAEILTDWIKAHPVEVDPLYQKWIQSGFGKTAGAEDEFDALVGILGMLNIILGEREPCDPSDPEISAVEGWILGRRPL